MTVLCVRVGEFQTVHCIDPLYVHDRHMSSYCLGKQILSVDTKLYVIRVDALVYVLCLCRYVCVCVCVRGNIYIYRCRPSIDH